MLSLSDRTVVHTFIITSYVAQIAIVIRASSNNKKEHHNLNEIYAMVKNKRHTRL